ncbi:DUF4249 domain-containing protein [Flagellimonas sp. 2504JD1-5]
MMLQRKYPFILATNGILALCMGCVEEFEPKINDFEDLLVVEATISNELKHQTIYLNRTFTFDDEAAAPETNAQVRILDDSNNEYVFNESAPGVYTSLAPFQAQPNVNYQLKIAMSNGSNYSSDNTSLPTGSALDSLYAERIVTDTGEEGMGVFIDNFDEQGQAKNYRYEYEETYKVIAPDWNAVALKNTPQPVCPLTIKVDREREERVCYGTRISNEIILASTENFEQNRLKRFMIRFVNRDNYVLSHRYSILVRQHVQSNEAFSFYDRLKEFSSSESLFSETQPGFLTGNLHSDTDGGDNVLGYFNVASISEKRIFFNYDDFFPGEDLPPYADPCQRSQPKVAAGHGPEPRCILASLVDLDLIRYVVDNENYIGPQSDGGPFIVVPRVCGDCTVLGKIEVPEFWIE